VKTWSGELYLDTEFSQDVVAAASHSQDGDQTAGPRCSVVSSVHLGANGETKRKRGAEAREADLQKAKRAHHQQQNDRSKTTRNRKPQGRRSTRAVL